MVEFAFSLPFLLIIILSIMYFGRIFYIKQALVSACQESARALSRIPNAKADPAVYQEVLGYDEDGQAIGGNSDNSIIAKALGGAQLLSNGNTGNLPTGSKVTVNWPEENGSLTVEITYPFKALASSFQNTSDYPGGTYVYSGEGGAANGDKIPFTDFPITEKAVALSEVYQDLN